MAELERAKALKVCRRFRPGLSLVTNTLYGGNERKLIDVLDPLSVNWFFPLEELDKRGIRHGKNPRTYVISPADESNKASWEYYNCIGVWVVGKSIETGRNISLLSHHPPTTLRQGLTESMRHSLSEFASLSVPGTVNAIIFGGLSGTRIGMSGTMRTFTDEYLEMIEFLREEINRELSVEPIIPAGPITTYGQYIDAYGDTESRTLYLVVPNEYEAGPGFPAPASRVAESLSQRLHRS